MTNTLTTLRAALSAMNAVSRYGKPGSRDIEQATLQAAEEDLRTVIASMEAQEPYAYCVYFPTEQRQEYCQELDELCDDLTNLEREITPLYTHAQPSEPKAEPSDDLVVALAEVRDMFPTPEHGSPIEREWASAMADPCSVPDYVRACISQPKSEPAHDDLTIAYLSGFHDGKKAKADPVQEPVATVNIWQYKGLTNHDLDYFGDLPNGTHALYAEPLSRKPLTVNEIAKFAGTEKYGPDELKWFRMGEAAHGIEGGAA